MDHGPVCASKVAVSRALLCVFPFGVGDQQRPAEVGGSCGTHFSAGLFQRYRPSCSLVRSSADGSVICQVRLACRTWWRRLVVRRTKTKMVPDQVITLNGAPDGENHCRQLARYAGLCWNCRRFAVIGSLDFRSP
jgi:hypothetical protein